MDTFLGACGFVLACFTLQLICFIIFKIQTKRVTTTKCLSKSLPRVRWFAVPMGFLDGFFTLLKLRKVGVRVIDRKIEKLGPDFMLPVANTECLLLSDLDVVKKILTSSDPVHLSKPKVYEYVITEHYTDGLLGSEYPVWPAHRKALFPATTYKGFSTYLKFMDSASMDMSKRACDLASQNGWIGNAEMKELIDHCAVKIITEILMSSDENVGISATDREEFHRVFNRFKTLAMNRYLHPEQLFPFIWKFHPRRKHMNNYMKTIKQFSNMIVNIYRQRQCSMENEDLLETTKEDCDDGVKPFQCIVEQMIQAGLSNKEIIDEINTMMSAGHETTSASLQLICFHLAKNPDCQEKCFKEISEYFKQRECTSHRSMGLDDLSELKYLERSIMESLRITPTVPFFLRRLDAPLEIDNDRVIEGNTDILISPWVIHRNKDIYPEPDKFDPDRFLPENVKQRHPYAFIPFSMGPRNCIGYKIAMMEMKVITAWVIKHFKVSCPDNLEDVRLIFDITLRPERLFNMKFTSRASL